MSTHYPIAKIQTHPRHPLTRYPHDAVVRRLRRPNAAQYAAAVAAMRLIGSKIRRERAEEE